MALQKLLCKNHIRHLLDDQTSEQLTMKYAVLAIMIGLGMAAFAQQAQAASCVNGVYRAGCVGPNGAAVVHKAPAYRKPAVHCANGVYRAGCVGPNGAAAVRKPY